MSEYVSCTQTAVLVRAALKNAFPGTRFTVRSRTYPDYPGSGRIEIGWTDGPQRAAAAAAVQPYRCTGPGGMSDLMTVHCHWLHQDGRAEPLETPSGGSSPQRTAGADGAEAPAEYARDYRHGVASVTGEQLAGPDPDTDSPAWRQGQADARRQLAAGARLVHFGTDFISTARMFSDGYRTRLERTVVFLAGEAGPFDPRKRYRFALQPGARQCEGAGSTLARQLSESAEEEAEAALQQEAGRRADAAAARYNAEHHSDRTGFYVTTQDAGKTGFLLGPYASKEAAEADVKEGSRLARTVDDRAVWYAYGVTKVTMPAGKDLPAGALERLAERQMTLAVPAPAPAAQ